MATKSGVKVKIQETGKHKKSELNVDQNSDNIDDDVGPYDYSHYLRQCIQ